MLLKIDTTENCLKQFHNVIALANSTLLFLSFFSVFSDTKIETVLTGIIFISTVVILSFHQSFRKNGFSVLASFYTLLYLIIPSVFVLLLGPKYIFGDGIIKLPNSQIDYHASLHWSFLFLTLMWFTLWLAFVTPKRSFNFQFKQIEYQKVSLISVCILGLTVAIITYLDNQQYYQTLIGVGQAEVKLISFLFFDHAFLALSVLLAIRWTMQKSCRYSSKKIYNFVLMMFLLFSILFTTAGSKAGLLTSFVFVFLFPLVSASSCSFPHALATRKTFIISLFFASFPIFYLVLIYRNQISLGGSLDDLTTLFLNQPMNYNSFSEIVLSILYRLSFSGFDRFVLVFQSFVFEGFDYEYSIMFIVYLVKNFLNLILPGTLFQDSYAPSSQLFYFVINKDVLIGDITPEVLIRSLNSQAYTLFGVPMILFGLFAPISLYVFVLIFLWVAAKIRNSLINLVLVYCFYGLLTSYGVEVVIANSVHFAISLIFMYVVLVLANSSLLGQGFLRKF